MAEISLEDFISAYHSQSPSYVVTSSSLPFLGSRGISVSSICHVGGLEGVREATARDTGLTSSWSRNEWELVIHFFAMHKLYKCLYYLNKKQTVCDYCSCKIK
jgi:hypothetical protein